MEKRNANVMFAKNGQGSRTTRITLPVNWVDAIEVTEENRKVFIYQVAGEIIITKEEWQMEEKKALEIILEEVKREIKEGFICDSDNTDRFIDETIKNTIKILSSEDNVEENIEDYFEELLDKTQKFLNDTYKSVSKISTTGDATIYYYDNCFDFETVEELEDHFLIGE